MKLSSLPIDQSSKSFFAWRDMQGCQNQAQHFSAAIKHRRWTKPLMSVGFTIEILFMLHTVGILGHVITMCITVAHPKFPISQSLEHIFTCHHAQPLQMEEREASESTSFPDAVCWLFFACVQCLSQCTQYSLLNFSLSAQSEVVLVTFCQALGACGYGKSRGESLSHAWEQWISLCMSGCRSNRSLCRRVTPGTKSATEDDALTKITYKLIAVSSPSSFHNLGDSYSAAYRIGLKIGKKDKFSCWILGLIVV